MEENEKSPSSAPSTETFSVSRVTFNYVVIAAVCLIAGLLIGGFAFGGGGSSLTRADVEQVVQSALVERLTDLALTASGAGNTEGVSRAELEAIISAAVAQNSATAARNTGLGTNDPYIGRLDAPVTIVEFSDFNCGFCTRFALETLPQILETYGDNVRFVYRNMPILQESSSFAAQAGLCAHEQGAFWEFHDYMFLNMQSRNRAAFIAFAEQNGLDVEQFTACYDENRYAGAVTLDLLDGQALGVRGTPAFFINGRFVSGAQPFSIFATVIEAELAKAAEG